MKRIFLVLGIVGLVGFTSCKKTADTVENAGEAVVEGAENAGEAVVEGAENVGEAVAEGAEAVAEGAESLVDGVPSFENEGLNELAKTIKSNIDAMSEAAASGDQAKLAELTTAQADWGTKTAEALKDASAEDVEKFNKWYAELLQESAQ